MRTKRGAAQLLAGGLAISVIAAACGDDDDTADVVATTTPMAPTTAAAAPTTIADATTTTLGPTTTAVTTTAAPATTTAGTTGATTAAFDIPGGSASDEFCQAFVSVELAFRDAPEDPAQFSAFAEERLEPNFARIEATLEEGDFADSVMTLIGGVRTLVETGDFGALETPEFLGASANVYPRLEEACGIPDVETTAVDYAFDNMPSRLSAGLTTFVMTNESQAGEPHEMGIVKLRDDVDTPVADLLQMPEDELEAMIEEFGGGMFAPPGGVAGTLVDLTPGRWIYACFIPVGTVGETEGTGPPHFAEGMYGEFTVE
jgi:hypothetical protein